MNYHKSLRNLILGLLVCTIGGTQAHAAFIGIDSTTQGTWVPQYNSGDIDGYHLKEFGAFGATQELLPSHIDSVSVSAGTFNFGEDNVDVRKVQNPEYFIDNNLGVNQRKHVVAFDGSSITVTITPDADATWELMLYFLDEVGNPRSQDVTVTGGGFTDTAHSVTNFGQGLWYLWEVQASVGTDVVATITRTGGANAALAGVFFGVVPEPASATLLGGLLLGGLLLRRSHNTTSRAC